MYNLFLVCVCLFELLISYIFFSQQGERRQKTWVCWTVGAALFLFGAALNILLDNIIWLNGIYFFLSNMLYGALLFDIRWPKAAFCAAILDALVVSTEFIGLTLTSLFTDTEMTAYNDKLSLLVLAGGIGKMLYFVICVLLSRVISREKVVFRFPKSFYFYPLAVVAVLVLFGNVYMQYGVTGGYLAAFGVLSLVLLFSTAFLFLSYQKAVEREATLFSLKQQVQKIETDRHYYKILEKQNEDLMLYAHDAKNHLAAMRELNTDPQMEEYLNRLSARLYDYSRVGHSGNRMLDIICSKYAAECSLMGLSFRLDTRLANFSYVADYDLVAILDNLLDNALEAAQVSAEKTVELSTGHKNDADILTIYNSCDTPPRTRGGHLRTTKTDDRQHGLGMKSVARALKTYHGDFDWNYDAAQKRFTVTVMIPHKTPGKTASAVPDNSK